MKIIKNGIKPNPENYIGECSNCSAIIQAKLVECTYDQREGSWHTCPSCDHTITMHNDKSAKGASLRAKADKYTADLTQSYWEK